MNTSLCLLKQNKDRNLGLLSVCTEGQGGQIGAKEETRKKKKIEKCYVFLRTIFIHKYNESRTTSRRCLREQVFLRDSSCELRGIIIAPQLTLLYPF